MNSGLPLAAHLRLFHSANGAHLFVVDGSRVYDVDDETATRIARALEASEPGAARDVMERLGLDGSGAGRWIDGRAVAPPALRSISLNVAQSCNMGCHYCYADAGRFGGKPRMMSAGVAEAAVDALVRESDPGAAVVVGFMGGEPLLNRAVVHHATRYAARAAIAAGRRVGFSITTNGTLLTSADAALFAEFPFSVQVSVDGPREQNDAARPLNDGGSSYDRLCAGLRFLTAGRRPRLLAARVTVTPRTGDLLESLDHLLSLGFDEVGFAPVLVSPSPAHAFNAEHYGAFLTQMVSCGEAALARMKEGVRAGFSNLETALREIHRGTHRPYPCGAGAAYLSANADGRLFACHRLVDDARYAMGDVQRGSDVEARAAHLERSHVDRMQPCAGCWARYLCGGGCYHEVSRRGRLGCDYIRGWLDFCLRAYAELSAARPEYFTSPDDGAREGIAASAA